MKLTEAVQFTSSVRTAWKPDAKGYKTAMINSRHCVDILGDVDVKDINAMSFVDIQNCLKAEGKSPATINRVTSALSTILSTLVQFQHLENKPSVPNLREPRGRTEFYSEEEVDRLLSSSTGEIHDIILFASKTGARLGEILNLKWESVRFSEGSLVFVDTKTHDDRTIPITDSLRCLLERLYDERTDNGTVFKMDGDKCLRELRKVQDKCGVSKDKGLHTFRHTAATKLWEKGANLVQIMDTLGHKNSATTLRYSHASMEGKTKALNLL